MTHAPVSVQAAINRSAVESATWLAWLGDVPMSWLPWA